MVRAWIIQNNQPFDKHGQVLYYPDRRFIMHRGSLLKYQYGVTSNIGIIRGQDAREAYHELETYNISWATLTD